MRKIKALAGVLVLAIMLMCISCFALTVSAAGNGENDAPQVVTADIVHDDARTAQADFDGDNAPAVVKTSSSSGGGHSIGTAILIGIVVAVIGTAIFVFMTINGYKNNGQTEPYPFSNKAPLTLAVKEDILINTEVTKRKIESNNNNK